MKKLFLIATACALSFTVLTGCGAGDVGGPDYQNSSQAAENSSQAAETSSMENIDADSYEANIDGLCKYFEDKGFVNKESKKDMYADVIGAKAGYKYEATINGANYIIELYEFDPENLDSHGSSTVSAVKSQGHYIMLENQINAMMSDNGKYMMSYGDVSEDDANKQRKEEILKAFNEFH